MTPETRRSGRFASDIKRYLTGFMLCLIVTSLSFGIVMFAGLETGMAYLFISILAVLQVGLQSYYFLHIGRQNGSKTKAASYAFMIMTVAIVVFGSLWVMANLNYNMMHDMKGVEQEIIKDEGIHEKTTREHDH